MPDRVFLLERARGRLGAVDAGVEARRVAAQYTWPSEAQRVVAETCIGGCLSAAQPGAAKGFGGCANWALLGAGAGAILSRQGGMVTAIGLGLLLFKGLRSGALPDPAGLIDAVTGS